MMSECANKKKDLNEEEPSEWNEQNQENEKDDVKRFNIPQLEPGSKFNPDFTFEEYLEFLKENSAQEYEILVTRDKEDNQILAEMVSFLSSMDVDDFFRYVTGVNRTWKDITTIQMLMDRDEPFRIIMNHKIKVYEALGSDNEAFMEHLKEETEHITENQRKFLAKIPRKKRR